MKWFRFYSEVLVDSKVQTLPLNLFRAWVNLLCLANDGRTRGVLPEMPQIAFSLRVSEAKAAEFVDGLLKRKLLVRNNNGSIGPHNWHARQPISDDVSKRVQEHRDKQKANAKANVKTNAETKAECNPDVTLQETHGKGYKKVIVTPRARKIQIRERLDSDSVVFDNGNSRADDADADEQDPSIRGPDHRDLIDLAHELHGEAFAATVREMGGDIMHSLGSRWDCFHAAMHAAKRSRKRIDNLYAWCLRAAQGYAVNGIPPKPVSHDPANGRAAKEAAEARLDEMVQKLDD